MILVIFKTSREYLIPAHLLKYQQKTKSSKSQQEEASLYLDSLQKRHRLQQQHNQVFN